MINPEYKRRFNIYAPRLGRMLLNKRLKHSCWFMHIPKSGGSSIHEALRALIPFQQHIGTVTAIPTRRAAAIFYENQDDENLIHEDGPRCKELFDMRELQLLSYMAHEDSLIYGHVLFSEKADRYFGNTYKYITMLRDPVQRVISNYKSAVHDKYFSGDFNQYLESDVARRHALVNLRYFSGVAEISPDKEAEAMEKAKINLEKFSVIGFLDNIEQFCDQFNDVFGARPNIPYYNKAKENKTSPTASQIKTLESICAPDIELFLLAEKKFK